MKPFLRIPRIASATAVAAACFFGINEASAQTLLLRYNFDESATGTEDALDSGATPAAPGTLVGATRVGTTPNNASTGALDSTGAGTELKYVIAGDVDKLDALQSFTLTAWINVQEEPLGNRRILAKQDGAPNYGGFTLNIANAAAGGDRTAANFGVRMFIGGDNGFLFDSGAVTIDADNKWVFLAVTYDGTLGSDNVKYYIGDTTTAPSNQGTTSIPAGTTLATTAPFGVGYTEAAPTANTAFPGWVDDARVYSGVLDDAALDAVRLENLGSTEPNAVLITDVNRSGNTVTFDFASENGVTHTVEYKNSLDDASWTELTTIVGDGTSKEVTDSNATPSTRFYRVVSE